MPEPASPDGRTASDPSDPQGSEALAARRRYVFGALLPLWLGVLLGFAAVDAVVAQVDRADVEGAMELGHPLLSWTNTAGFVDPELDRRHDRFGLRNDEIPADANPREVRVLGMGDSRIYGAGDGIRQQDVWNHALERFLNNDRRVGVRVLNGGVMGYSVAQACRRAGLLLDAVEPDLVVVVASTGPQALLEDPDLGGFVEVGGHFVSSATAARWHPSLLPVAAAADAFLGRWSAIYSRKKNREVMQGSMPPRFLRWMYFGEADPQKSRYLSRCLQATWDSLAALRDACAQRGVELRVAIVPSVEFATDLRWENWTAENAALWGLPADVPPERSIEAFEAKLEELGVASWDLSEDFRRMGTRFRQHFIEGDVHHWTPEGHQRIAEALARVLLQDGLLRRLTERRAASPRARPYGEVPR